MVWFLKVLNCGNVKRANKGYAKGFQKCMVDVCPSTQVLFLLIFENTCVLLNVCIWVCMAYRHSWQNILQLTTWHGVLFNLKFNTLARNFLARYCVYYGHNIANRVRWSHKSPEGFLKIRTTKYTLPSPPHFSRNEA